MRLHKNFFYKLLTVILIAGFLLLPNGTVLAAGTDVADSVKKAQDYYKLQPTVDEWETLALRWSGMAPVGDLEFADPVQPSDYARAILGSIAANKDKAHVDGLITALQAMQQSDGYFSADANESTLNQTIWPLIALDFAEVNGYSTSFARPAAVQYVVYEQDTWGGFDESGWGVDVDSTAHALISLAPYRDQAGVETSIDKALVYLQGKQFPEGGFGGWGAYNPDSTAAVIEALMALDIDPEAGKWGSKTQTMVEVLLDFQSEEGWFVFDWTPSLYNDPTKPNPMSTRNALLALGDLAAGKSKYQSVMPTLEKPNNGTPSNPGNSGSEASTSGTAFIAIVGDPSTGTILPRQAWSWATGTPTVLDALIGILEQKGIAYNIYSNGYVASLGGLAEKQPGYPLSGWLYSVNGQFLPAGANQVRVYQGDDIRWLYTLDGGQDIGNPYAVVAVPENDEKLAALLAWAEDTMKTLAAMLANISQNPNSSQPADIMSQQLRQDLAKQLNQHSVNLSGQIDEKNLWLVDPQKEIILYFPAGNESYPGPVMVKEGNPAESWDSADLITEVFTIDMEKGSLTNPAIMAIRVAIPAEAPSKLFPAYFDPASQQWLPLPGAVDWEEGWIVFEVYQPGQYAILAGVDVLGSSGSPAVLDAPVSHDPTEFLIERGVIQGTGQGFEWERLVSRAELAQMLYRLSDSPALASPPKFSDVEEQQWFTPAVSFMAEQQVMVGYPSGYFYPDGLVNRYQMASILERWFKAHNVQLQQSQSVIINDELPDWAAESVQHILNSGIMTPVSGTFAGDQVLNRQEVSIYIYRALMALEQA